MKVSNSCIFYFLDIFYVLKFILFLYQIRNWLLLCLLYRGGNWFKVLDRFYKLINVGCDIGIYIRNLILLEVELDVKFREVNIFLIYKEFKRI